MTRPFRLKTLEPTETQVVDAVLQALEFEQAQGRICWFARMNTGGAKFPDKYGKPQFVRFGFKGSPDIHGMMSDGRAMYLEVKSPRGRVREEQKRFLDKVIGAGAVGGVVRSADEAVQIIRGAFE